MRAQVWGETADGAAHIVAARAAIAAGEALAVQAGAATYAVFLAEEHARLDRDSAMLLALAENFDMIGASGHSRRVRRDLADRKI